MPFPDFTPTVPELLHTAAARFGAHPYLVVEGERLSYADAERRSAALAKGMLAEGIGKGARVGILMPNSVDFAVAAFAVARMGAVFVPINTFSQTRELRLDCSPRRRHAPRRAPAFLDQRLPRTARGRAPRARLAIGRAAAVPARRAVPAGDPRVGSVGPHLVTR